MQASFDRDVSVVVATLETISRLNHGRCAVNARASFIVVDGAVVVQHQDLISIFVRGFRLEVARIFEIRS